MMRDPSEPQRRALFANGRTLSDLEPEAGSAEPLEDKMGTPALVKQIKKAVEEKRFDALQREKAETAKLCDEALTWLSGEDVRRDFMIVTRRSADGWRHALKYGLLGYSASSELVVI